MPALGKKQRFNDEGELEDQGADSLRQSGGKQKDKGKAKGKGKMNPRTERRMKEEEELLDLERRIAEVDPTSPIAKFGDLPLSTPTLKGLASAYYSTPTSIQAKALPFALAGRDVLGAARTGSGKTLAFLVPLLERLWRKKWGPMDGLGALVISPTRELAVQIFEVLRKIGSHHSFSAGLVIGGKSLKEEQARLARMNILVATPGRLLQHMDQTVGLNTDSLEVLILDEADRILDLGFASTLNAIVSHLPPTRQTMLFSATQTKSIKDLARLSLQNPEYVAVRQAAADPSKPDAGAENQDEESKMLETPKRLEQHYMVVSLDKKLDMLWSFVKMHLYTKTLVFLSSCKQVRFVYESFRHLRPGVPLLHLHGKQKQGQRLEIYQRFSESKHACLFATDIAARGLDFPAVDWVVQVDLPEDIDTYVHRVGRTARYESSGKALLFVMPSEEEGLKKRFEERGLGEQIRKIKAKTNKQQSIQNQLQSFAFQYPETKFLAQRAFISYVRSVYLQKDKTVFKLDELPLDAFAASLGLAGAPKIKFVSKSTASQKKNAPRAVETLRKAPPAPAPASKKIESDREEETDEEASPESEEEGVVEGGDDDSSEDVEDEDGEQVAALPGPSKGPVNPGVRTKYDRMFQRKNQNVLSDHYTKLIDRSEEGGPSSLGGGGYDDDDDFMTIKRRDHELEESTLPDSDHLSKRKLRQGQSKKAMAAYRGLGKKITFDDEGEGHELYELEKEEDFKKKAGDQIGELQRKFVEDESKVLKIADVADKRRVKELRQERKRKRKDRERDMLDQGAVAMLGSDDEGGFGFDDDAGGDGIDGFGGDSEAESEPRTRGGPKGKRRRVGGEDLDVDVDEGGTSGMADKHEVDLEALALRALRGH